MAENLTIARPYAEAAFAVAKASASALASWQQALENLASVMSDPAAHHLVGNPEVGADALFALITGVVKDLGAEQQNFVRLLVQNDRLKVLPEVLAHFIALRDEHEQVLAAVIRSALPLSQSQVEGIVATLTQKYGRPVRSTVEVDPELIGGVSIVIGDQTIDASVSGKLNKMASALMN